MKEKIRKYSEKDLKVINCIALGFTDAEISSEIGVTAAGVRNIVNKLLNRSGTVNRAHLVYDAYKNGLIK